MVFGTLIYLGLQSFLSSQSELYFIHFEYDDYHIHYEGLDYVEVYGSIYNSGNSTATDIQLILVLQVYDWTGADHSETKIIDLGDIHAKTYREINTKIYYSGQGARIIHHELRWTRTEE